MAIGAAPGATDEEAAAPVGEPPAVFVAPPPVMVLVPPPRVVVPPTPVAPEELALPLIDIEPDAELLDAEPLAGAVAFPAADPLADDDTWGDAGGVVAVDDAAFDCALTMGPPEPGSGRVMR